MLRLMENVQMFVILAFGQLLMACIITHLKSCWLVVHLVITGCIDLLLPNQQPPSNEGHLLFVHVIDQELGDDAA